jgi:hypothetical protein
MFSQTHPVTLTSRDHLWVFLAALSASKQASCIARFHFLLFLPFFCANIFIAGSICKNHGRAENRAKNKKKNRAKNMHFIAFTDFDQYVEPPFY